MARQRNQAETVTITLSTTPQVRNWLEILVANGSYGKNIAEAAERLISETLREMRGEDLLFEALRKADRTNTADVGTVVNLETP